MYVPASYRPTKIGGDAKTGNISLGDSDRTRLVISWATVRPFRLNPDRLVRRQLRRGLTRRGAKKLLGEIEVVTNPTIDPMYVVDDDQGGLSRCVGYSSISGRLIDLRYYQGNRREDQVVRNQVFARVVDQPLDQSQRWAFFDVSFVAAAGMQYEKAQLNIGDMGLWLAGQSKRRWWRAASMVRQIYPAELALKRQPLSKWMDQLLAEQQREYRLPRSMRRGKRKYDTLMTPLGQGVSSQTRLRQGLRPVMWRAASYRRHWLIHDQAANRLVILQVTDQREELEVAMKALLDGLHWAYPAR